MKIKNKKKPKLFHALVILSNNLIDRINCLSEAPTSVRTNQGEEKDRERERGERQQQEYMKQFMSICGGTDWRWSRELETNEV